MKKALVFGSVALTSFALPLVSLAALNDIQDVGEFIIDTINGVFVPVLFAIAFIVFIWGAFKAFILGATNDSAKDDGKNLMFYGLIGFVVMVSVWGLVNILTNTLGLGDTRGPSGGTPSAGVQIGG